METRHTPGQLEATEELIKDYTSVLKTARSWLHNSEYWGEDSWIAGKSVDDVVEEKFHALTMALRARADYYAAAEMIDWQEMVEESDADGNFYVYIPRAAYDALMLAHQKAQGK